MPAQRVVSKQQLERLVSYMEENRDLAVGKLTNSGPHGKQQATSRWETLAAQLNAVGVGATKTTGKWKDYWSSHKYSVRKRAQQRNKHARGKSGGPPLDCRWDPIDERTLNILGKVAVFRNPSNPTADPKAAPSMGCPAPPPPELLEEFQPIQLPPKPMEPIPPAVPPPPRALEPSAPQWALQIEERRVAAEVQTAAALRSIAASLNENTTALAQIAQLLEKIYNASSTNQ